MRVAYADPPYPGQSAKHYAEHVDYAGEVDQVGVCRWLFEVCGLEAEDELVDLFPGTGAVGQAWAGWRFQMRLIA